MSSYTDLLHVARAVKAAGLAAGQRKAGLKLQSRAVFGDGLVLADQTEALPLAITRGSLKTLVADMMNASAFSISVGKTEREWWVYWTHPGGFQFDELPPVNVSELVRKLHAEP